MEWGFAINRELLDDNVSSETLVAQRIVHDHMLSHSIKPYQTEINSRMMELVKNARKCYLLELKEKGLKKLKTSLYVGGEKLNEEIEDTNSQFKLLESTLEQLKADADKFSFAAEKKTPFQQLLFKILAINKMVVSKYPPCLVPLKYKKKKKKKKKNLKNFIFLFVRLKVS